MKSHENPLIDVLAFLFLLVVIFVPFAAWITHVVACISVSAWILLLIGAFIFPIGIIHGIMVWLGIGFVPV